MERAVIFGQDKTSRFELFAESLEDLPAKFGSLPEGFSNSPQRAEGRSRDVMLHSLHVSVDSIFVDVKNPKEFGQELVTVNDCFCDLLPLWGQGCATVFLVFNKTL